MSVGARLWRCRSGAAAVEMALVAPLLLALLFGSVELGKYFLDQHVVVKAVRDGARFAARQPMADFVDEGAGCIDIASQPVAEQIQNFVRTGNAAGSGARLAYWTDAETVTVTSACSAYAGGEALGGIYGGDDSGGAPVVTVSVTVPYRSLFGFVPFAESLEVRAEQQAVVTGR